MPEKSFKLLFQEARESLYEADEFLLPLPNIFRRMNDYIEVDAVPLLKSYLAQGQPL